MYLIDTNVLSELRRGEKANSGVIHFFKQVANKSEPAFISVVTLGELRRGVELIRHRGDSSQAQLLEDWLKLVLQDYSNFILRHDG